MMSLGLLPPLRHGETALFAVTAGALMWMYKKGPPKVTMVEVRYVSDRYQIFPDIKSSNIFCIKY